MDLFLILLLLLVLCAGAYWAWRTRDRWRGWRPDRLPFTRSLPASKSGGAKEGGQVQDLGRESARVQAEVRRFLDETGLKEKDVLKSFAQERRDSSAVWLEATLEFTRPADFDRAAFLKKLVPFLRRGRAALLRDEDEGDRWVLDFGEGAHVFQRVVVRDPPKPLSDIFKKAPKR